MLDFIEASDEDTENSSLNVHQEHIFNTLCLFNQLVFFLHVKNVFCTN